MSGDFPPWIARIPIKGWSWPIQDKGGPIINKVVLQDPPRKTLFGTLLPEGGWPCSKPGKTFRSRIDLLSCGEPAHPGSMFETSQAKRLRNVSLHNAKYELAMIVCEQSNLMFRPAFLSGLVNLLKSLRIWLSGRLWI
jgi:hypothetical protein